MSTVRTICPTCGHAHRWSCESAFDKFGFEDGDGLVMTEKVADALRKHGYKVETMHWGFHNTIITDVSRDNQPLIPRQTVIGYDDPRKYLPKEVIDLLDGEFRDGQRIEY
jgi:hypothetical protein